MHYLTKRTNAVKSVFSITSKKSEYISLEYLDEWIVRFEDMYVVAEYTIFTESTEKNNSHEQVVWIDPEGFTFGWKYFGYGKENDNTDFESLAESFKEDFYEAIKKFKNGKYKDMFFMRDESHNDTFYVFFIEGGNYYKEHANKVFTLTKEIENGFRNVI